MSNNRLNGSLSSPFIDTWIVYSRPFTRTSWLRWYWSPLRNTTDFTASLLIASGSVEQVAEGTRPLLQSQRFFVSHRAAAGWEAAVYDHYRAVVRTICNRLEPEEVRAPFLESIGGSTYTFDVGPDHPLEGEVLALLSTFREQCHDLRARVALHNDTHGRSVQGHNVVVYVGESVIAREPLDELRREDAEYK